MPKKNLKTKSTKTKSTKKKVDFESDNDSGASYQDWLDSSKSEQDSDEEEEPPKRMQPPKQTTKQQQKQHAMDPVTSDSTPVPLQAWDALMERNQQVHMLTRVTQTDVGYLTTITKCAGMEVDNVKLVRDPYDHTVVKLSFPSVLENGDTVRRAYEDTTGIARGSVDVPLGINPSDTTLTQMANHFDNCVGPQRAEEILPTSFQVFQFPKAVKSIVSGFTMVALDGEFCCVVCLQTCCSAHHISSLFIKGTTRQMEGLYELGGALCFHFPREDYDNARVNSVKRTPPRRNVFGSSTSFPNGTNFGNVQPPQPHPQPSNQYAQPNYFQQSQAHHYQQAPHSQGPYQNQYNAQPHVHWNWNQQPPQYNPQTQAPNFWYQQPSPPPPHQYSTPPPPQYNPQSQAQNWNQQQPAQPTQQQPVQPQPQAQNWNQQQPAQPNQQQPVQPQPQAQNWNQQQPNQQQPVQPQANSNQPTQQNQNQHQNVFNQVSSPSNLRTSVIVMLTIFVLTPTQPEPIQPIFRAYQLCIQLHQRNWSS
jgi:hypothetical protein